MQSYTDKESKKKKKTLIRLVDWQLILNLTHKELTQTNQQRHEGKGHNIKEQSTWGSGGHNHVNEN